MLNVAGILHPLEQNVLRYVHHARRIAYAHTCNGILPPHVNLRRTYNVTVRSTTNASDAEVPAQALAVFDDLPAH